jgi:hypothetical protein
MGSRSELDMRIVIWPYLFYCFYPLIVRSAELLKKNPMIRRRPEWYIEIFDWSFYVAWGGVAMIYNITIQNTSEISYENIKVKVPYYSTTGSNSGVQIGQETGSLPVILKPNSKKTYLKNGTALRLGSANLGTGSM